MKRKFAMISILIVFFQCAMLGQTFNNHIDSILNVSINKILKYNVNNSAHQLYLYVENFPPGFTMSGDNRGDCLEINNSQFWKMKRKTPFRMLKLEVFQLNNLTLRISFSSKEYKLINGHHVNIAIDSIYDFVWKYEDGWKLLSFLPSGI